MATLAEVLMLHMRLAGVKVRMGEVTEAQA